ncbi:hypothetical protein RAY_213 [Erwinia phage vB_EamM_RAY]|uniref:Uncharacterized protein n=1 Tax=Erwinia phage vB_EamM_RAY TaxID=1815987 RepID=A0A173GEI4_9CAUD|nr:hypothetical protein FDH98_gp305 [Erwinia phage vB_EamM_RAY]ANH51993.1 hypothetical protein RAY_213 [Erwinia phage vB_EamM_RAY]
MSEVLSRTKAIVPCGELLGSLKRYPGVGDEAAHAFITAGAVHLFHDRYVDPILSVDDLALIGETRASVLTGLAYEWLHDQFTIIHNDIKRHVKHFDELRADDYSWEGDCIHLDLSLYDED